MLSYPSPRIREKQKGNLPRSICTFNKNTRQTRCGPQETRTLPKLIKPQKLEDADGLFIHPDYRVEQQICMGKSFKVLLLDGFSSPIAVLFTSCIVLSDELCGVSQSEMFRKCRFWLENLNFHQVCTRKRLEAFKFVLPGSSQKCKERAKRPRRCLHVNTKERNKEKKFNGKPEFDCYLVSALWYARAI